MTENDIRDQLVLLVCDELDETQRRDLNAAMRADPALAAQAQQLAQAMKAVTPTSPPRLGEDFNARLWQRLEAEPSAQARAADGSRFRRPKFAKMALAAAAAVLVAAGLWAWLGRGDGSTVSDSLAALSILSQARAAENATFLANGMVHIRNEIVVYPVAMDRAADASAPRYTWIPMCSLRADGRMAFNQLRLPARSQAYTVADDSWYDGASGRFTRVVKSGDAVVFANSFDGSSVYTYEPGADGALNLTEAAVAKSFTSPKEPAAFLGLSAGLPTSLDRKQSMVEKVSDGKLADGSPAWVYKASPPAGPEGPARVYWLFKVRQSDKTLAEEESYIDGKMQLSIRRVLTEPVQEPGVPWTLAELKNVKVPTSGTAAVSISPDMVRMDVTVAHMVKVADFETYTLSKKPAWTGEGVLTDILDVSSPPKRMFLHASRAQDGRHVVMVQSPTFNERLMSKIQGMEPAYTSPNGFKLFRFDKEKEKWFTNILLMSAQYVIKDAPAESRIGGLVLTPANTLVALAVNGPLSDEELHSLIDNLVPAKDQK